MAYYQYPLGDYAKEQPLWINFYVAPYSLINFDRTRPGIQQNSFHQIKLPFARDMGYSANHEFGMGFTPLLPSLALNPNMANNGGAAKAEDIKAREQSLSRSGFFAEYQMATSTGSTLRRFSNITELTMVSEARKKYVFEYILAPKNKIESLAVEDIIGTFRKTSYPTVANGLPERTYPQNLWMLTVTYGNNATVNVESENPTDDWLGDPLPMVLKTVTVKKNDRADPIVRILPNGYSNITLLGLVFEEFETGSFDSLEGRLFSKSEVSYNSFGSTSVPP